MTVRGWTTGTAAAIGKGPAVVKKIRARRRAAADLPCVYRGEPIDRGDCPACNGTESVAIYACEQHARCTIDREFPGAHRCAGCRERRPPAAPPPY